MTPHYRVIRFKIKRWSFQGSSLKCNLIKKGNAGLMEEIQAGWEIVSGEREYKPLKNLFQLVWQVTGIGEYEWHCRKRSEKQLKRKRNIKYKYHLLTNARCLFTIFPNIKMQLHINYISQDMPSYVGVMNDSKSLSHLRQSRFIFHPATCPSKVIWGSVLCPPLCLPENSPSIFPWWLKQDWKMWLFPGWFLKLLFKAYTQEWTHWQVSHTVMPKHRESRKRNSTIS